MRAEAFQIILRIKRKLNPIIGNFPYRQFFYLDKFRQQKPNSRKEPFKSSKIPKFALQSLALQSLQIFSLLRYARKLLPLLKLKVVAISMRNTIMRKFANFVRLYFPHITTFFNQILGFYYF